MMLRLKCGAKEVAELTQNVDVAMRCCGGTKGCVCPEHESVIFNIVRLSALC